MIEWHDTGHMAGMWLFWILPLLLLVLTVWLVTRATSRRDGDGESAEERLKRRYAEGEIDKDEYEARLKDLRR